MIIKKGKVGIVNKRAFNHYPMTFTIEYEEDIGEHVLSEGFFVRRHFSIEELGDLIKVLKDINKNTKEVKQNDK